MKGGGRGGVRELLRRWFPRPIADAGAVRERLAHFYATNTAYHRMTAGEEKVADPQVRLLQCLLEPGKRYAEVGCGGGRVCRMVAQTASVVGIDTSEIPLTEARKRCANLPARFVRSPAEALPFPDNAVDGTYSFELLEHVWDPVAVVREMVRITKRGGFILLSAPLHFSLDAWLPKRALSALADLCLAALRRLVDWVSGKPYLNVAPDIAGDVYPDCDMVTALVPANFTRALRRMGCEIAFWDTTYMQAHREGAATGLCFQRRTGGFFSRHFGDHLLLLGRRV